MLGVRSQCQQQALERVGGMGVIDIGGGAVGQAGDEFHAAAHAAQMRNQVPGVGEAGGFGQRSREQNVIGLEPARQRELDAAFAAAGGNGDHLPVRQWCRGQQSCECTRFAHRAQIEPAFDGDGAHRIEGGGVHVRGDHRGGAGRQ